MKKVSEFFKTYWSTIAIIVVFIVYYTTATEHKAIDTFVFPTPDKIAKAFVSNWDTLILNMFASFSLLFPSLFLGTLIAFAFGIAMGLNKKIYKALYPIVYPISVIPSLLLSPIALHVAPSFRIASEFLIVYAVIWPTLFAVITGIETIDTRYLDNAATLEITGLQKVTKVILPAAMPSIMSGFITSLRSSFVILVFAEMYGTEYGMGYFIKKFATHGIYPNVWCGFIFMVVVLVIIVRIFEVIKNYLLRWTITK